MGRARLRYGFERKNKLIRISLTSLHPFHFMSLLHVQRSQLFIMFHQKIWSSKREVQSGFPKETKRLLTQKDPTLIGYLNLLSKLVLQVCLKVKISTWYLDSGCSRHMRQIQICLSNGKTRKICYLWRQQQKEDSRL